jgi:putative tryptophan/tyrosine transport system substrate-binding protein
LSTPPLTASTSQLAAFRQGLAETGYVDGRNATIDFRFAQSDIGRLSELAADLVRRNVAVIAALGSTPAALSAKAATAMIPIVFGNASDLVQVGLVSSFNRPGGNITGFREMNAEVAPKRLARFRMLVPEAERFGGSRKSEESSYSLCRHGSAGSGYGHWAPGRYRECEY